MSHARPAPSPSPGAHFRTGQKGKVQPPNPDPASRAPDGGQPPRASHPSAPHSGPAAASTRGSMQGHAAALAVSRPPPPPPALGLCATEPGLVTLAPFVCGTGPDVGLLRKCPCSCWCFIIFCNSPETQEWSSFPRKGTRWRDLRARHPPSPALIQASAGRSPPGCTQHARTLTPSGNAVATCPPHPVCVPRQVTGWTAGRPWPSSSCWTTL